MDSDSWLDGDLYGDWDLILEDQPFPNTNDLFDQPPDGQVELSTMKYFFEERTMEINLFETSIDLTPAGKTTSLKSEPAADFAQTYVFPIDLICPRIEEVAEDVTPGSPKSRTSSVTQDGIVDTNGSLITAPSRRLDPEQNPEYALEGAATQSIATSDSPVYFDTKMFSDFLNNDLSNLSELPSFGFGDSLFDQSTNDDITSLSTLGSGADGHYPSEAVTMMSSTLSNPRSLLNDNDHGQFTDSSINDSLFDADHNSFLSVGSESVTGRTTPAADVAILGSSVVTSPRTTVDKLYTLPTAFSGTGYSSRVPDWFPLELGDGGETVAINPFAQDEILFPEPLNFENLNTILPLSNQFNPNIDLNTVGKGKPVLEMSDAELQAFMAGKHLLVSTSHRGSNLFNLPIRTTPPSGRALLNTPPPRNIQVKSATPRNSLFHRDNGTGLPTHRSATPCPSKNPTTGYAPAITPESSRRYNPNLTQTRARMSGLESPHFVSTELPAHPYTSAESVNLKQKRKRVLDVNESPAARKGRIVQTRPSSTVPGRDAHPFTTPPRPIPQPTLRRPAPPIALHDRIPLSNNVIPARHRTPHTSTATPPTVTSTLADTYSWFHRPDQSTSVSLTTSRPALLPALAPAPASSSRRRTSNPNKNTAAPSREQPRPNRWLAFMTPEGVVENTTIATQAQWDTLVSRATLNHGLIMTKDGMVRRMVMAGNGMIVFVPVQAGHLD